MTRAAVARPFKELAGTTRPDRTAGATAAAPADVIAVMPAIPTWLKDKWAIDEWHRLGPILLGAGLLTRGNINAFAQLCAAHGKLATGYEAGGHNVRAADIAQYIKLVSEFGLTPASAAKVRAPDPSQNRSNPFAGNGKPANR